MRKSFQIVGRQPIRDRWVGLCEVPDLDLLPRRYLGVSNVIFRAGAELRLQNWVLWLLSFAVRWRLIGSLKALAPLLIRLQSLCARLGSDRSAMSVTVTGRKEGTAVEASWTLIAEDGHGPWVPSFAAVIAAQKLLKGELPSGAFPASDVLTLADFGDLLGRFHLFTETRQAVRPAPLYMRVMAADFAKMPAPVQAMHAHAASTSVVGRGEVTRGTHPLARLAGALFRFPPAMADIPVAVTFDISPTSEIWTRDFAGHRFASRLSARRAESRLLVTETFGPSPSISRSSATRPGSDVHYPRLAAPALPSASSGLRRASARRSG